MDDSVMKVFSPEELSGYCVEKVMQYGAGGWDKVADRANVIALARGIKHVRTTHALKLKFQLMVRSQILKPTRSSSMKPNTQRHCRPESCIASTLILVRSLLTMVRRIRSARSCWTSL